MKLIPGHTQSITRKPVTFEYDARSLKSVDELQLVGSFDPDSGAYRDDWNGAKPAAVLRDDGKNGDRKANDGIYSAQVSLQTGNEYSWGAVDKNGKWMVVTEHPPHLKKGQDTSTYAPISNHLYSVQREGNDFSFRTWAPNADKLSLEFYQDGEKSESVPLTKVPHSGDWSVELKDSWNRLEGQQYKIALRDQDGEILKEYGDPHARMLQGQQRGLERIFVDPVLGFETGWYDDSGSGGPNYADNPQWGRFTVDSNLDAEAVHLVLRDSQGKPLNKADLLDRLGKPEFQSYEDAPAKDKQDVDVLKRWQLTESAKINPYVWLDSVADDGKISMNKVENPATGGGWVTALNSFEKLVGLEYTFEAVKDGKIVGDLNGDGKLDKQERAKVPFNEADNKITPNPGSARAATVTQSSFVPKYADTPRKVTDPAEMVIYEAHVGSFLSSPDNAVAPTFEDMIENLDYLENLGANTIELLPTQEFGGKRDWGYTPDYYFAGADAYGFEMKRDQAVEQGLIKETENTDQESVWVNGTDALKLFVDQAHSRGFQVLGDVVYNHTSGKPDGDNPLAQIDGEKSSFFKWDGERYSNTPWGRKPNYADPGVKQFFSDHATQQIQEFGFDGLRFDFTQVLHNTGSAHEQIEGMDTLRQVNRAIDLIAPNAFAVAEDFSGNWLVAADYDKSQEQHGILKKGMGFDAVWNDRFRDDVFKASENHGSMDRLMDSLVNHHGVSGWDRGVLYAHSHDEVGNSGEWIGRAAAGSKKDEAVLQHHPRSVSRSVAALTLLGPGTPMLWQGEEFLANNDFKHGLTSTWGQDTSWMEFPVTPDVLRSFKENPGQQASPELEGFRAKYESFSPEQKAKAEVQASRTGHHKSYQDLIALRTSSDAFRADASVSRVKTHNDDKVMAFARHGSEDQFVVATNFSSHNRDGYTLDLPEGQWKEVFNSNAEVYGGNNHGNGGATVGAQSGVVLPAGSTVVFKRV